ncbi:hypothetical protein [Luteimicrobium sp. DT211]|uniref:hypothetical protein n=1 Tax=Luteimicrobium sp. DT211 TaxID=3393412 RepID=UPI003CED681D
MNATRSSARDAGRRPDATRPHRAARVLLGVVVAAVVVGVVWKVGTLRDDPAVASTAAPSTVTTTLPSFAAGSTAGALAPDLPADLAPVPSGATVLSSSAERTEDGAHLLLSLSLRTTSDPSKVVTTYTKAWAKAGFTRASGKPQGADAGATYRKVSETAKAGTKVGSTELADYLQVAVVDEHGTSLVTVSGQVEAPKTKKASGTGR